MGNRSLIAKYLGDCGLEYNQISSIPLFDKCCKVLSDYMHHCQGLRTEKELQLDRFCTAWEDLKWERDSFAKEINRRDCCGEGYLDKKMAKKVRSGKYWGSE